jgi:hypothetical protein
MKIFKTKDQEGLLDVRTSADDEYIIGVNAQCKLIMQNSRKKVVFSMQMIDEPISKETIIQCVYKILRLGGVKAAAKIGVWNSPVQESKEAMQRLLDIHYEYCATPEEKFFIMARKNPSLSKLYRKLDLTISSK